MSNLLGQLVCDGVGTLGLVIESYREERSGMLMYRVEWKDKNLRYSISDYTHLDVQGWHDNFLRLRSQKYW